MTHRTRSQLNWAGAAALVANVLLLPSFARADVSLAEKDGWEVFLTGRIQMFGNYNDGVGRPTNGTTLTTTDANGGSVEVRGGGVEKGEALPEFRTGITATADDPGKVQELRIRSGFTGNVLGFGVKKRVSQDTEIFGFTAVTVGIDSEARRKFNPVRPDWRESFLRVTSWWGSLTAGRQLLLFSRGATEITYLYGYRYGLGFPGTVSNPSQSTAGSVGFGVLGNGFGAGLAYASPVVAGGLQLTVGAYDANNIVATQLLERTRWVRPEAELTYTRSIGPGMFKLFVNGAWQRLYDYNGTALKTDVYGSGFGARLEVGPVRLGVAGHWGKGVGVTYSLEPHGSVYFVERTQAAQQGMLSAYPNCATNAASCPPVLVRTVDGAYAQAQVAVMKNLDLRAGFGISRVHQLPEDKADWKDADMMPGNEADDDGVPGPDSVGYVTLKHQMGMGGGLTYHAADSVHFTVEYFRAAFVWYVPVPSAPGTPNPSQTMNFVNAGVTYDF